MLKALIPVDGSKTAERAVRHVIELGKGREPMEIHLLNVQEEADAWEVRRFLKPGEIKRTQLEHGEAALASAKKLLERAGVEFEAHVLIGDPAEKIAQFAKRNRFDKIIIGTHGRGSMTGLLMGSVASKVLHLAAVPVTLVK
jgi:nucleotide-binding universal stress UspA family protein